METCKPVKSSKSRCKHDAKRSPKKKKKINVVKIIVTNSNICCQDNKKGLEDKEKFEKEVRVEKNVKDATSDTGKQNMENGPAKLKTFDENRATKKDLQSRKNEEIKVIKDNTVLNNKLNSKELENFDKISKIKQLNKEGRQLCKTDKNGREIKFDCHDIHVTLKSHGNHGNQDNRLVPVSSEPVSKRYPEILQATRQQSLSEETPLKEFCVENGVENECEDMQSYKKFEEKEKDDCSEKEKLIESDLQYGHEKDCDFVIDKTIFLTHPMTESCNSLDLKMGGSQCTLIGLPACSIPNSASLLEDAPMLRKIWKNLNNQRNQTDQQCKPEQVETGIDDAIKEHHLQDDISAELDQLSRRQFVPETEDKEEKFSTELQFTKDDNMKDRIEKTESTVLQVDDKVGPNLGDMEQDRNGSAVVLQMKEMESDTNKVKDLVMNLCQEMETNMMQLQDLCSYITKETRHKDQPSVLKYKEKDHKFPQLLAWRVQTKRKKLNEKTKICRYQMPKWINKLKGDNSSELQDADGNNNKRKPPGGNSNRGDRGHSSKENSRHHDNEKDIDEQEHPPGDKEDARKDDSDQASGEEHDKSTEATSPSANFKYRKKYGIDDGDLTDFLGKLIYTNEAIPPDLLEKVDECLVTCLTTRKTEDLDKLKDCNICVCLLSLLSHFGSCEKEFQFCSTCVGTFRLVQHHLQGCTHKTTSCSMIVCQKIQEKIKNNPEKFLNKTQDLWRRLKKYLARCADSFVLGIKLEDRGGDEFASMGMSSISSIGTSLQSTSFGSLGSTGVQSVRMQRISTSYYPSLRMIPEDINQIPLSRSYPSRRKPNSAPVASRNSNTGEVTYHTGQENLPKRLQSPRNSLSAIKPRPRVSFASLKVEDDTKALEPQSLLSNLQVEELIESLREPRSIEPISLNREKTYGASDLHSMPLVFNRSEMFPEQLLSLEDKPTGVPGVGEVVYGTRDQLIKVIRVWTQEKEVFQKKGQLHHRHIREEGVILVDYKKQFELCRTRYQKNFQWIRLTHLGTGMSGKCHLAMDYNTEYKFCVKKIYLAKYEEVELNIWSDLNHPNIVQLHGAIRREAKVYIFAEFIDGGCLTKTINDHKAMNRRLSHRMALLYLKQILQVLVYLEKKSIIHEDIKADNILLKQNSSKIVITDFGVASRVIQNRTQRGTSPIGTPTNFSPEKAESRGHGVKSDVWSAVCVLIHMLSGNPPWVKRFPSVKTLNYIIASKDPPVVDLPKNVTKDVQELVEFGLNKNPDFRPTAAEMLQHKAFRFLDDFGAQDTTSILMSSECHPASNTLGDEPLDEIDKVSEATIDKQGRGIVDKIDHFLSAHFDSPVHLVLPPDGSDSGRITAGADSLLLSGADSGETTQNNTLLPASSDDYLKDLGVSWPPKAPKYEIEDPMIFIRKYLLDSADYALPERITSVVINPVYQLQTYKPTPSRTRSSSSESDKDIEERIQAILDPTENDVLPDFSVLIGEDNKEGQSLPEEVQDLHNRALEQGIHRTGGLTTSNMSDTVSYQRSISGKQDSDKYDEELRKLQLEVMDPMDPHREVLDIMDFTATRFEPSMETLQGQSEEESPLTTLKKSSESSENTVKNNIPNILLSIGDESPIRTISEQKDSNNSGIRSFSNEILSSKSSGQDPASPDSQSETGSEGNQQVDKVLLTTPPSSDRERAAVSSALPIFDELVDDNKSHVKSAEDAFNSEELFGPGLTCSSSPVSGSNSQLTSTLTGQRITCSSSPVSGSNSQLASTLTGQRTSAFEQTSPAIVIDKSSGAIPKSSNTAARLAHNEHKQPVQQQTFPQTQIVLLQPGFQPSDTSEQTSEPYNQLSSYQREDKCPEPLNTTRQIARKSSPEDSGIKRANSPRLNFDKLQKPEKSKIRTHSEPSFSHLITQDKFNYYTPQQEKSGIGFTGGQAVQTSGIFTGSPSKSIPFFKDANGDASSGVFTASPDDKKRSFDSFVDEKDKEIAHYMRDLSHHSEASQDTSQLDDFEENAEQVQVKFYEPSEENEENEFEMSLQYIQEQYAKESSTDTHGSSGVLVRVVSESDTLFEMKLQGEHVNKSWESILEGEINDKIHDHGHGKFTIKKETGEHLDLGVVPRPGVEVLQVVDVTEESAVPWHCERSVIMK